MKIKDEYPNFLPSLMFYIGDKNPVKSSNDSKILSYFIGLRNFKKGFDFYELKRLKSGGVQFSVVTMIGLKTIVQTNSEIFHSDLTEIEWQKLIGNLSNKHFMTDKYRAIRMGHVPQASGGGCLGVIVLMIISSLFSLYLL